MKGTQVTVVRVYFSQGDELLDILLRKLHDEEHVRGASVFKAVAGFGDTGGIATTSLTNMTLKMPMVLEFYDRTDKVEKVLANIRGIVKPCHLVWWHATVSEPCVEL